ncbi:hypothetical protein FD37_GL001619 [Levilactobacillus spicheri DSM 15429]|uniref:Antitoxin n=1 Tax=Levilactobacillus spicheri DSM 15429 TaxID=1423805 RepID=A0A0R1QTK2_9LACO|nr:hypothetical protein FD37_GL001619 [Levilactobacillus spicheri DSM 15429]
MEALTLTKIVSAQEAQAQLTDLTQAVATSHDPVIIHQADPTQDAVLLNKHDYDAMCETLALIQAGSLAAVRHRFAADDDWTTMEQPDSNW